ncbi:hypothetical protein V6N13_059854 [Hibiscus sabdariffa]
MRWKDPYGSSLSTVRQKAYVEALRLDTMFTPQIVVQGRAQCVANEEDTLLSTIINAPRFPAPSFQLSEELLSAREEARVAREKLAYSESEEKNNALWLLILYGDCDFAIELSKEVEDLISEAQESKEVAQKLSFLVDKAFQIKKFVRANDISRFGFVRIRLKKEAKRVSKRLDGRWIYRSRIWMSLAKRVWISDFGLPIHVWKKETFEQIASVWGSVICVEDETLEPASFERGRVLIESASLDHIEEQVELKDSNAGNIHEELGEDCVLEDIGPQGPSDVPTPISDQGEDFPLSYQREELD